MPVSISAVICDSAHEEVNGKFILVGVIAGVLSTSSSEMDLEVTIFARVGGLPIGAHKVEVRQTRPDGRKAVGKTIDVSNENGSPVVLQLAKVPLKTSSSGTFYFHARIDGGKWLPIVELPVMLSAEDD